MKKEKMIMCAKISRLKIIAALLLFCAVSASADVIFVDDDSTAILPDGSSWELAFTDLQDALAAAGSGDDIWVAAGLYVPGTATNVYFVMKDGVDLYGSFAGTEDPAMFDLADRDFDANPTTLSGQVTAGTANLVIYAPDDNFDIDPVVDGFIVSGGKWGIRTNTTDLIVRSCVVRNNDEHGFYAGNGASPLIEDCIIEKNGLRGMNLNTNGSPIVTGCIVRNNMGDGIYYNNDTATITNCWIHHNDEYGVNFVSPTDACVVRNNTIAYNTGAGIYNNLTAFDSPTISNCIIWENGDVDQMVECEAVYSCVMNGAAGIGNIFDDPMFAYDPIGDPNNYDFHILSGSSCIDAGNPDPNLYVESEVDIDGDQRVLNYVIDMGADEYLTAKTADFDDSGKVTYSDFAILTQTWLISEDDPNFIEACDLDGSGDVDTDDLLSFADQWLYSVCDFDNNGVVNNLDFAILKRAWLTSQGDPEFNETCDIDRTGSIDLNYVGTIDINDLVKFAHGWLN